MDNRKKILIVDDEPLYIDILVELLSDEYDITVATNGADALERALVGPDLILLDVMLPDMNGYDVCKRLKREKRSCNAPVIFLTIRGELDDEMEGFKVGAVDYISKPMNPSIVKARVKTHLELSGIRNQLSEENIALLTEQKKKDIEIHRKEKMAALGTLASGIAHDFNNILSSIVGYSELLTLHITDVEKVSRYAAQIKLSSERGSYITRKLLTYSRQENTHKTNVDINCLLNEDKNLLSKSLTPNTNLQLNLDKQIWPVYLDKSDLQDAILNISINASHAMPTGGALTFITSNKHLSIEDVSGLDIAPGAYVCLSIHDTGIGMDQRTREKIFDPFFSTKGEKGTGLGMSQVYRFVEKSSGAIKIESQPDQGTKITLYFPRNTMPVTSNLTADENKYIADYVGKETILIVDDEEALRNLFTEYLSGQGYEVFQAKDANNALKVLQQTPVHLMLCDVIMPGMDGYKLAETVQLQYPATKIQMISGYSDDRHKNSSDNELHKQRIHKPVHLINIAKRVRELLD